MEDDQLENCVVGQWVLISVDFFVFPRVFPCFSEQILSINALVGNFPTWWWLLWESYPKMPEKFRSGNYKKFCPDGGWWLSGPCISWWANEQLIVSLTFPTKWWANEQYGGVWEQSCSWISKGCWMDDKRCRKTPSLKVQTSTELEDPGIAKGTIFFQRH